MRGSASVNSPSAAASEGCIPRPATVTRLCLFHALPSAWTALPSPPTALPSRAGAPLGSPPRFQRMCPARRVSAFYPLGAMTVGGWDCVWGKAG